MRTVVEFGERQQRQVILGMPGAHCISLERKSRIKMPTPRFSESQGFSKAKYSDLGAA